MTIILFVLLIGLLISCDTECLDDSLSGYNKRSVSYSATGKEYDVFYPEYDGQSTYMTVTVDNLKSQDVYFIFSNVSMSQSDTNPKVSGHSGSQMMEEISRQLISQTTYDKQVSRSSVVNELRDTVGQTKDFYISQNLTSPADLKSCTCLTTVEVGDKQLSVWVQDSLLGSLFKKRVVITDEMAQAIADRFMKPGDDNDIYDWVTHIYGDEWGEHSSADLIEPNNNITILLVDDNATGNTVTLGYFYSADNYTKEKCDASNERIMFYMNGNYYAKKSSGESVWQATNTCPSTIHSTLAHEFQHMIHFYQKTVRHNKTSPSSTWLNETCSLVTEDLIAEKLGIYGPRGRKTAECQNYRYVVTKAEDDYSIGRMPYFNECCDKYPIFNWSNNAYIYSLAYSFGAFLVRNFGGPELFRRIVQSDDISDNVVFTQTGQNIQRLMRQWGAACMLSDLTVTDSGLRYNNGSSWMTYTLGGLEYNLGSINLFNYAKMPVIYDIKSSSEKSVGQGYSLGSSTNRFAVAAESKTGTLTKYVKFEANTALTIVVK